MKTFALFMVLVAVAGGVFFLEQHKDIFQAALTPESGFPGPLRVPDATPSPTSKPTTKVAPSVVKNPEVKNTTETTAMSVVKKIVSAAEPLIHSQDQSTPLTADGVFAWTNVARIREDAKPILTRNPILDKVAQLRAADMFQKQYFEHKSPQGVGASDIAEDLGYAYLGIGENIALGGFGSDEKLVDAWMNSPHHRANILNTKFTDIGIATVEGVYEGHKTWIGVQIFGRPLSACRNPDPDLLVTLGQDKNLITILNGEINALSLQIQTLRSSEPVPIEQYNQKVNEYNQLVGQINPLSEQAKQIIEVYNKQVKEFNTCIVM